MGFSAVLMKEDNKSGYNNTIRLSTQNKWKISMFRKEEERTEEMDDFKNLQVKYEKASLKASKIA